MDKFFYLTLPDILKDRSIAGDDPVSISSIFNIWKQSRPFLISRSSTNKMVHLSDKEEMNTPLDLPFERCIFQTLENIALSLGHPDGTERIFGFFIVHENGFNSYDISVLEMTKNAEGFVKVMHMKYVEDTPYYRSIIRMFLKPLRSSENKIGQYNPRASGKLRLFGKNEHYKIKDVVIVVPSKQNNLYTPKGVTIDWSHRWEVRGHWRKCSGIGKDRYGNYEIPQFTWVKGFIKGPENKILVKKKRILPSGDKWSNKLNKEQKRGWSEENSV